MLIAETDEQDAEQIFGDLCRGSVMYDVVNSLLKFGGKSVSLGNACEFLRQHELSVHFAAYCKDMVIEDLEREENLGDFLVDEVLF